MSEAQPIRPGRTPLSLTRLPADILGRFRFGVLWFCLVNFVAFIGLALAKATSLPNALGAAVALLVIGSVLAHQYRRRGPTVLHDIIVAGACAAACLGLPHRALGVSLLFAWLSFAQLYPGFVRAILRLALAAAAGSVMRDDGLVGLQPDRIIGLFMASLFSFALGTALSRVQASEARYRGLLEHSNDLFLILDELGAVKYASANAAGVFGQMTGRPLADFVVPPERTRFASTLAATLGGTPSGSPEFSLTAAAGQAVPFELIFSDQRQHEDLEGVVVNARDISARVALRQQQQALQNAQHEVEIATQIQASLLPRPTRAADCEFAAFMLPAAEVGGDYYDVIPSGDAVYVTIGDVSGHGLQAGLVMLMAQSAVAALIRSNPHVTPAEVVVHVNQILYENLRNRLGRWEHLTLTVMRIDANGTVTHAGAHEDILVKRATGAVERLATQGAWVGALPDITAGTRSSTFAVAPGDLIVLHSDGITEARNAASEEFGLDRLGALVEHAPAQPEAVCDRVKHAIAEWNGARADDQTLLALSFKATPGRLAA